MRYSCSKCFVEYGTGNMIAYCAYCYDAFKARLAHVGISPDALNTAKELGGALACGAGEDHAVLRAELSRLQAANMEKDEALKRIEPYLPSVEEMLNYASSNEGKASGYHIAAECVRRAQSSDGSKYAERVRTLEDIAIAAQRLKMDTFLDGSKEGEEFYKALARLIAMKKS